MPSCPDCGYQVDEDDDFCADCGTRLLCIDCTERLDSPGDVLCAECKKKPKVMEQVLKIVPKFDSEPIEDELAPTIRLETNLKLVGVGEKIREQVLEIVGRKTEWQAGKVAVTDLTRFPWCLPRNHTKKKCKCYDDPRDYSHCEVKPGAKRAQTASDNYVKAEGSEGVYYRPTTGAPRNGEAFLNQWESRQESLAKGKLPASECSNFSYDAIAECLLNDELRQNYDILQAGTMDNQHNIAILVPKGQGARYRGGDTPLPPGTLIVDPWALAMGHDADASLFATPDKFAYKDDLYPLDINFNSANVSFMSKSVEEQVQKFKENRVVKKFYNSVTDLIDLNEHGIGGTTSVSEKLAEVIRDALKLPEEGTTIHGFKMDRGAGILEIDCETTDGRVTIDRTAFLKRCGL